MKKAAVALVLVVGSLIGACRFLLPERFAVNVPIRHMLFGRGGAAPAESQFGSRIRAAAGFSIGLYAADLPNARFLRPTAGGGLLVSQPRSGRIVLLEPDADRDGRSDGRRVLLEELNRPHGIDLHQGWLYVAEGDGVGRVRFDEMTGEISGGYARVVDGLPSGGNHWSRTVRFGPDGWMYVSVGSSCNVCEDAPRRAALLRFRPDGSGEEIYATGLRNTVGFDWRPGTDELYATDNGRDLLGNDFPPCELNRIVRGGFYGWPYANGDRVADPDLGELRPDRVRDSLPPAHDFRAHNSPLGITFIRGDRVPAEYRGAALAALHGSWNRTHKDGYKVVSLHWQPDGRIEERDFVVGFEKEGNVIGRPVDVAEAADGAIYISDDYAGAIYRVVYGSTPAAALAMAPKRPAAGRDQTHPAASAERGRPDQAARVERGEALYERFACASCHEEARAESGAIVVELADLAAVYSLDELAELLETPTPPMPVFPMDPEERRDLAVFLLSH